MRRNFVFIFFLLSLLLGCESDTFFRKDAISESNPSASNPADPSDPGDEGDEGDEDPGDKPGDGGGNGGGAGGGGKPGDGCDDDKDDDDKDKKCPERYGEDDLNSDEGEQLACDEKGNYQVCHRTGKGKYENIEIPLEGAISHLSSHSSRTDHGDYVIDCKVTKDLSKKEIYELCNCKK